MGKEGTTADKKKHQPQAARTPCTVSSPLPGPGQGGKGGSQKAHTREGAFFKAMARRCQLDLPPAAKRPLCYFIFTLILCDPQRAEQQIPPGVNAYRRVEKRAKKKSVGRGSEVSSGSDSSPSRRETLRGGRL